MTASTSWKQQERANRRRLPARLEAHTARLETLASLWGFAFIALLVVLPWAYAIFPLLAAVTLLPALLFHAPRMGGDGWLDRDDIAMLLALLAYGGLWCLDVWRSGQWPIGEGNQGVLLPLWPLLGAALLLALRSFSPEPRLLWLAVSCGAVGAGGIALFERLVLGKARASNGMNAIPFGNLSLLLGGLSLLGALWCLRAGSVRRPAMVVLGLLAAMAGMVGSLLSGTRGGWIAAPLLLLVVYRVARNLLPSRTRRLAAGTLMALLLALALIPQSGVRDRVALAYSNLEQYWAGDSRGTSVGLRLEMWRAGGLMFLERPLFGWGEGEVSARRDELIDQAGLHAGIRHHDQLHSELIDTAARRGLVGVAVLVALYVVPLGLFWRRLRSPGAEPGTRLLAAAGMMVPVAFIDFGLTQSMLRDVRGLSGYLGLCVVCWAVLRKHEPARP
ncbi:O-antigen ligase family protein [Halomonas sp. MCCC 1A17488]|uniref:O-antigen ligase family protein n=1 Tax=unclassified Halomonas TaxID=2609666 RepID=UPI0018D1FB17|nr:MULTISPECIES: O-antigen ligase family protein [unclassified Halomonas]MCE8014817.1 O-antigen ligase family protein [Halomonas sp. MCCC 1A17488]MCG3238150.1 O-antigen ligase family protein [Halomonas sp. MCCC 1A17488]QPP48082.1 O-antigen ligase family protein [Halomonas sp. SS10-MC5]